MDVLIVEPLEQRILDWLDKRCVTHVEPALAHDPHRLRPLLARARAAVVPASVTLDAGTLLAAPSLRAVARLAGDTRNIDLVACHRAGIELVLPGEAHAAAEAEFAVAAVLQLLRGVPVASAHGRVGRELASATVGIVGLTPAARSLAQIVRAFGARTVGYDPAVHASDLAWRRAGIPPVPVAELFQGCDAVVVMLGDHSRYRGLLGERLLSACKPEQVIVSLSRSTVFDEHALAAALVSGRVAAAWFDHLEPGWLDPGRPLWDVDTLHVTARQSAATREARSRGAWAVARRIASVLGLDTAEPDLSETVPSALAGPAGASAPA